MVSDEERAVQYEKHQDSKRKTYIERCLEPSVANCPISTDPVLLSIAISLKRIADYLLNTEYCGMCDRNVVKSKTDK